MLKNIKAFDSKVLIESQKYKDYVINFESEIVRGISKLIILSFIDDMGEEGIYGYKLARMIKKNTNNMLIIEEGTLYPILRRLNKDGLLKIEKKEYAGRLRNYYIISETGKKVYNHLIGFFIKLIKSISPIMNIELIQKKDNFIFCPNCTNRINLKGDNIAYCNVCGLSLENIIAKEEENNED
ncbi:MAG: PadR family transcriptional regulator [Promethearchaeota archaeon]